MFNIRENFYNKFGAYSKFYINILIGMKKEREFTLSQIAKKYNITFKCITDLVNEFSNLFYKQSKDTYVLTVDAIKEIDDMNLSFVGTYEVNNSTEKKSYACHYLFNERYYPNSLSGERLIEKAEKFYGKESMSEIMDKVYQEKITYLSGIKEITKEEYNKLIEEKQDLMKVVCLKKGKELIASIKK